MAAFSSSVIQLVKRAAIEQGGVISGDNPTIYNAKDPLRLWVIQVVIIITCTQLLSLLFARIRQPRVIAEVVVGIILGPSIMGRIPKFNSTIFPASSIPLFTLTANVGLVLFLFLIGLEVDLRLAKRNAKASSVISVAGLCIPLGMGAGLGAILYPKFIHPTVNFGYFILFTAVAIGITAFPVLCRILTELKLLDTSVGVVVLSAGVGNDVVGWILLALTVALVNAANGLTALWVLLAGVGFSLFMLFPVRWAFKWLARRTGSLGNGQPTMFMMVVTLLLVLSSAFFTDIIGIHAVFGAFLTGVIIPHDNGFAIALVEKFEDLVSILFLPLYFTLSGLQTNLGLLNTGTVWGYTILICVFAFVSKFFACSIAARIFGFNLRESAAIGSLMSCKGLIELIVLNIGLQAGVLDTRVFSMFVVHAIVLTCMTTPLVTTFYPEKFRVHLSIARDQPLKDGEKGDGEKRTLPEDMKTKFSIVLDSIDQLSTAMTLTQILLPPTDDSASSSIVSSEDINIAESPLPSKVSSTPPPRITIDALRLIELTDRASAVLKSQEADALLHTDPIISVFRTFGYLNRLPVSAGLSVVSRNEFSRSISDHVRETGSEMVILPWTRAVQTSSADDQPSSSASPATNPFEALFRHSANSDGSSSIHSDFIRRVFMSAPCDVALFLDRGVPSLPSYASAVSHHLFLPFFGGPDDRLALTLVVQLCGKSNISATVVKVVKTDVDVLTPTSTSEVVKYEHHHTVTGVADTVYPHRDTQTQLASDTADNLLWNKYSTSSGSHSPSVAAALTRITFTTVTSTQPLHTLLEHVAESSVQVGKAGKSLMVVIGRSRRMAVESHQAELLEMVGAGTGRQMSKTLGDVGAAVLSGGTTLNMLVLQARHETASQ